MKTKPLTTAITNRFALIVGQNFSIGMKMAEVNFNAIRKSAAKNFNRIAYFLNEQAGTGNLVREFDCEEIKNEMDDLRQDILAMCCCFIEDDHLFTDISDDIELVEFYPDES